MSLRVRVLPQHAPNQSYDTCKLFCCRIMLTLSLKVVLRFCLEGLRATLLSETSTSAERLLNGLLVDPRPGARVGAVAASTLDNSAAHISMVLLHDVWVMVATSSLPLGLVACTEALKHSNRLSSASARKFLHIVTGERLCLRCTACMQCSVLPHPCTVSKSSTSGYVFVTAQSMNRS